MKVFLLYLLFCLAAGIYAWRKPQSTRVWLMLMASILLTALFFFVTSTV
jgi:hypothetical protein